MNEEFPLKDKESILRKKRSKSSHSKRFEGFQLVKSMPYKTP